MTRESAYRIQLCWSENHFFLYLRSLFSGQPESPLGRWLLSYPTESIQLELPNGCQSVVAYKLKSRQLVDTILKPQLPFSLGGDAAWALALIRWILSLYAAKAWYPEVKSGSISLGLLVDSIEATAGDVGFNQSLPPSLRAACPQKPKLTIYKEVTKTLANSIGWLLLAQGPVFPKTIAFANLPTPYQTLIQALALGKAKLATEVNFFDHRQANLSLPERNSRLAFLITPPAKGEEPWQLHPMLQSLSNPSETCDALLAWSDPSLIPLTFLRSGTSPRFHLLLEFGRALRIYPDLGASLAGSAPVAIEYDKEQMADFLKSKAQELQAFGYPLLGSTELTRQQSPALTLNINPDSERQGLNVNELLDFNWSLAINDSLLDREALEKWLEHPTSLLYSKGRWFWVHPKTTLKALRTLSKQPSQGTLLDAFALTGSLESMRLVLAGKLSPLQQQKRFQAKADPPGFCGSLRSYQKLGFSWLWFMHSLGLGACLADDMGLGKTIQTLALMASLKAEGRLSQALLVCPTSVLGNWQREAAQFTPGLRVLVHHGLRERVLEAFIDKIQHYDLILVGYPLLTRDRKIFLSIAWDLVVLDEAQQIKNSTTQVAKTARELQTRSRVLLTGTPIENKLSDLFSLFRFLQPELLGSHRSFINRFCRPIEIKGDLDLKQQLKGIVGPFILRRTKTDPQIAPELPAKIESIVACSLMPEQAKAYQAEVDSALNSLEGQEGPVRNSSILRLLIRLKLLCDHPALLEDKPNWEALRSGKIHRLYEILDELPQDEGILIFSQFSSMVRNLQTILTRHLDQEVLAFDGSVPRIKRDQMVLRYQSGRGPRIFIISLKAGGVGLNLTRATTVIHFDRWWNPAVENQATDRAFRIGQHRAVQVFKFSTQGTLEEQVDRILQEKQALASRLIEEGDSWLEDLNDSELLSILLPEGRL